MNNSPSLVQSRSTRSLQYEQDLEKLLILEVPCVLDELSEEDELNQDSENQEETNPQDQTSIPESNESDWLDNVLGGTEMSLSFQHLSQVKINQFGDVIEDSKETKHQWKRWHPTLPRSQILRSPSRELTAHRQTSRFLSMSPPTSRRAPEQTTSEPIPSDLKQPNSPIEKTRNSERPRKNSFSDITGSIIRFKKILQPHKHEKVEKSAEVLPSIQQFSLGGSIKVNQCSDLTSHNQSNAIRILLPNTTQINPNILYLIKIYYNENYISVAAKVHMTLNQVLIVACERKQLDPNIHGLKIFLDGFLLNPKQTVGELNLSLVSIGAPMIELFLVKQTQIELQRGF